MQWGTGDRREALGRILRVGEDRNLMGASQVDTIIGGTERIFVLMLRDEDEHGREGEANRQKHGVGAK